MNNCTNKPFIKAILVTFALLVSWNGYTQTHTQKTTPQGTNYWEYLPPGYNSNTDNYPILFFFHGIGERGNTLADLSKVLANGPPKYINNGYQFPFIVISPQLKTNYGNWPPTYMDDVVEYVKTQLRVDLNRIYVSGLSLGGGGAWYYAQRYPEKIAAVAPVCGSRNLTSEACFIAAQNVPVWAFHGDADATVSVTLTINMVNAINACTPPINPTALMTIYPGVSHSGCWNNAYRTDNSLHTPNIYQWLLQYSKSSLTVNAGADINLNLPTNSVTINGTATTGSGTITSYAWQKLAGPAATLSNASTASLSVTGMVAGAYTFRLTVTNSVGDTSYDDVVVVVSSSNQTPIANAGPDVAITLPTNSILINGSGSDPDGSIASYSWAKVSGPTATMSGQSTANLSLSNLLQGTYVYALTVTDNLGSSATDNVQISVNAAAVNQPPTANAGPDKTINLPTNSTNLVGTGSDPDGSIATYLWEKLSGPAATTGSTGAATLSLSNLVAGVYTFRLTVTDNMGATASDQAIVTIAAANQAPIANAGADQVITLPTNSTNVTGSTSDLDGTVTGKVWSQVSGPGTATLTNPNSNTVSIGNLVQGIYTIRLTATDNNGATGSDDMTISVNSAPVNSPPVANAGPDKSITLPVNSVSLSGSGTDSDGTIASYAWIKVSGPTAVLSNANTSTLSVASMVAGSYSFQLTVTDNSGATGTSTALVTVQPATVNQSPVANAGPDKGLTLPTNFTTLNGSGTDADGTIASYAWTKQSGPTASLAGAGTANLSLSNLIAGTYVFRITVTDDLGATSYDEATVTVSAANVPPVASAGPDKSLTLPTNSVVINGSGTDADGSIVSYAWSVISGPAQPTITNGNTATATFSNLVQGSYTIRLTVTDNSGDTGTDEVKVIVNATNMAPVASAGTSKTITLPTNSANFAGSGTDADGTIASYVWSVISGPAGYTLSNQTTPTVTITVTLDGVYTLRLVVTDNLGLTAFDDVTLTVNQVVANQAPTVNAGSNQTLTLPTSSTTLVAIASDPDGSIASYQWTKVSGPGATLTNATTATLSVSAMVQGNYLFRVSVTDNGGLVSTNDVTVNVLPQAVNQAPIANAGADKTITLPTNSITLFGSGSDSDGSISAYAWTKLSGPTAVLTNAATPTLSLSGLVAGNYVFELSVTDNLGSTATDNVTVVVNTVGVNQSPTANAGPDQFVTLPTDIATLSGSGSDPDGSIAAYAWSKVSGPSATLGPLNGASLSLSSLLEGTYVFQLLVTDDMGASNSDNVAVTVLPAGLNQSPVVSAGADKTIFLPSNSVVLTGAANDTDGTIVSQGWSQTSGPSAATLTNDLTLTLTVEGLVEGTYVFRLSATDDGGASTFDEASVVVQPATANQPPLANAGSDVTIKLPTNTATIDGSGTDPDGSIVSYLWTKVSGPTATLVDPSVASLSVTGMLEGVYQFELTVTDDGGETGSDMVSITVLNASVNLAPSVDAGANTSVQLPTNSVTLAGSDSDDGTIVSITWEQVSGPSTASIADPATINPTVGDLVAGDYVFKVSIEDDGGLTASDEITVTVFEADAAPLPLVVDVGPDITLQLPDNTVDFTATIGSTDALIVSYSWSQTAGSPVNLAVSDQPELSVTDLTAGMYAFKITVTDVLDRVATDVVNVLVLEENPVVKPSNIFSPNNDGQFDTWKISNAQLASDCKITVYSRQGNKVFESVGYDSEWDGYYKGSPVPEGVYFYTLECTDKKESGSLTIIR